VIVLIGELSDCGSGLGVDVWCVDGDGRRGSKDVVVAANERQLSTLRILSVKANELRRVGGLGLTIAATQAMRRKRTVISCILRVLGTTLALVQILAMLVLVLVWI